MGSFHEASVLSKNNVPQLRWLTIIYYHDCFTIKIAKLGLNRKPSLFRQSNISHSNIFNHYQLIVTHSHNYDRYHSKAMVLIVTITHYNFPMFKQTHLIILDPGHPHIAAKLPWCPKRTPADESQRVPCLSQKARAKKMSQPGW